MLSFHIETRELGWGQDRWGFGSHGVEGSHTAHDPGTVQDPLWERKAALPWGRWRRVLGAGISASSSSLGFLTSRRPDKSHNLIYKMYVLCIRVHLELDPALQLCFEKEIFNF